MKQSASRKGAQMAAAATATNGEPPEPVEPPQKEEEQQPASPSKKPTQQGSTSKRLRSNSSKQHNGGGSVPGSDEVLGLVQDYIAPTPDNSEQKASSSASKAPSSPRAARSAAVHSPSPASPKTRSPRARSPAASPRPLSIHRPNNHHAPSPTKVPLPAKQPFSSADPGAAAAAAAGPAVAALTPLAVEPLDPSLLPAVGASGDLSAEHLSVLGAWYSMYCPVKEAQQQAALLKHYDAKARFEDNFVQVFGRDQIGVQFYGMRRLVKAISLALEKVEVLGASSSSSGGGGSSSYQLRIISRISFYWPALIRGPVTSFILPPALEAWATDTLTVRASDHKVLHHQQRVHNIPTAPWPLRWYLGLSSSLFMMHALGW